MVKKNCQRAGYVDVHKSHLVSDAKYAGRIEIPMLQATREKPHDALPFSQAIYSKNHNVWVHFYEDDYKFERIWRQPKRYLKILSKFPGVISPDFSLYRDMPLVMQYWNIYRSRAIAHALQSMGVPVIPNIRFGDNRTWKASCLGVPKHCTIAVGSHGNLKDPDDRKHFIAGLEYVIATIEPKTLVVFGPAPQSIFGRFEAAGIELIVIESSITKSRKRRR